MTELPRRMHELLDRYGDPLPKLDHVPRTAGEIYRDWAAVPEPKSLSARERNERRWLAKHLQSCARRGEVERRAVTTPTGNEFVTFNAVSRPPRPLA
ncbi:MAG: hypothetical protein ACJ780_10060 [Solirubrobacteraceae bacterium]|jgi:hypothetical protein